MIIHDNEHDEEFEIVEVELETEHDLKVLNECWHISAHPKKIYDHNFNESLVKRLNSIGSIENIKIIPDALPQFNEYNPESGYLGFEIDLKSDKTKNEIEDIFKEVRNEFKIRILPPNSSISEYLELIEELSDKNLRIGEILKEIGSLTDMELEEVLNIQKELADDAEGKPEEKTVKPIGELLLSEKLIQEPILRAALKKQNKVRDQNS